ELLERHGEFYPYGVALEASGEAKMLAGDPGLGDQPPPMEVLQAVVGGLQLQRDGLRATAVVADVRLPDSDAVRVELEHRDGHAITVFLPYRTGQEGLEVGELVAVEGAARVWLE